MTTLGEYKHWLNSQGGHCKSGIQRDDAIGMVPVTKLISPAGKSVVFSGGDVNEVLAPSMIDYLDRRLGMLSPFKGVPKA